MYTININSFAKIFSIVISGDMTQTETQSCIKEFKVKVNDIVPSEYALIFDTKDLNLMSEERSGLLREVQALTMITPFKARFSFA